MRTLNAPSHSRRPITWLALGLAAYAAVYAAWLIVHPLPGYGFIAFEDVAGTLPAFAASALCLCAFSKSRGRARLAWLLVGSGCLSWGLGEAYWTTYEVILRTEGPFPSPGEAGYLLMIPLMFAGILLLSPTRRLIGRVRTTFDAVALVLAVAAICWQLVLRPIYGDATTSIAEKVIGSAYPIGDLFLLFALAIALNYHRAHREGIILSAFSLGLVLFCAADIGYAYLQINGVYSTGSMVDLLWPYAFLLIGFAGALQANWKADYSFQEATKASSAWRQALPLGLLLTMFGLIVYGAHSEELSNVSPLLIITSLVVLAVVARQAAVLLDNVRLNRSLGQARDELEARVEERTAELKTANRKLSRMSRTDDLTGLANHRALMEVFAEEVSRSVRRSHPVAIMMMDLDGFKLFNEAHGHPEGDRVLRELARVMKQTFRKTDVVGRYGGDEFMAILPGTDRKAAIDRADRLIGILSSKGFHLQRGGMVPLAISVGLAACPEDSAQKEELLAYADSSLYEAKQVSGNNVVIAHASSEGGLFKRRTTFGALESLVLAVDRKDRYTLKHSQINAEYSVELGKAIGLSPRGLSALRIAGLLHDVGKIGVPDDILKKPDKLTDEERVIMQEHVTLSNLIVHGVPNLQDVSDAVFCHHERWDGKGYPRGLKGEETPMQGRIMAIVDAYSAMTMDRPYRKALTQDEALAELQRNAGTQFDPELARQFIDVVESRHKEAA